MTICQFLLHLLHATLYFVYFHIHDYLLVLTGHMFHSNNLVGQPRDQGHFHSCSHQKLLPYQILGGKTEKNVKRQNNGYMTETAKRYVFCEWHPN